MKRLCFLIFVALLGQSVFGTELQEVITDMKKYEGRELELVGIARVPGYFYLFADEAAAAQTDLSKALLVRKNLSGPEYRELDRQWVRVTGTISSTRRDGWDARVGLLLKQAELLRDRPPPRIKDSTVLGIFQNATDEPLAIELLAPSNVLYERFWLRPRQSTIDIIKEGEVVVAKSLKGPTTMPLDKRPTDKVVARGPMKFRHILSAGYEYSPEWSDERRFYYKIVRDRIEQVPAAEGRRWDVGQPKKSGELIGVRMGLHRFIGQLEKGSIPNSVEQLN